MTTSTRWALGALGLTLLLLAGVAGVVLNWDAVSRSLEAQSERAGATLFRMGELMSIGAALEAEYGGKPGLAYDIEGGVRVLSIAFSDYRPPESGTLQAHAREVAAFALGQTAKFEQVDVVTVEFPDAVASFSFERLELMRRPPRTRSR